MANLIKPSNITFDPLTHTYFRDDGKILTGVTTMMRNQGLLPEYFGDMSDYQKRGTAVHALFEDYDNGLPALPADVISDNTGLVVQSKKEQEELLKAYARLGLRVIYSEFLVCDNQQCASFVDKIIETDKEGVYDLADVKTTSEVHRESVSAQLSFYSYMLRQLNPDITIRNHYCIHARNGQVKLVEVDKWSDEIIKSYLDAEAKGEVYEKKAPDALCVLSGEDIVLYNANEQLIEFYQNELKKVQQKHESLVSEVYRYMMDNNIPELRLGDGVVKLKQPYQRESVDSQKLREKFPDVYDKCKKVTEVKGTVSYKVK